MIIVPVSGGKDSQACLKMAVQEHGKENVLGLFCDTQFEHPKTYAHIDKIRELYGAEIVRVCGGSVLEESKKNGRFPGGGARFCTDKLKIRETKIFLKEYAEKNRGCEVWYGMRTGESSERAKRYEFRDPDDLYLPHEVIGNYPKYLGELGVRFRVPIVDWSSKEVMAYLDGEHNPLYDEGFDRVGCFPCLAAGKKYIVKAFNHDDFGRGQLIAVQQVGNEIGKDVFGNDLETNQGCLICQI